jgi:hypothetical protein
MQLNTSTQLIYSPHIRTPIIINSDKTQQPTKYITAHALSPKGQQGHLRHSSETFTFYQNYLAIEEYSRRDKYKIINLQNN